MQHRKPASPEKILAFMAGLAARAHETRLAQGYLAELLARLAFGSHSKHA